MSLTQNYAHHGFVRLPPDSTGKNMQTYTHLHVNFVSGTRAFSKREEVIGNTSALEGIVWEIHGTTAEGTIIVTVAEQAPLTQFTIGEILTVDGTSAAVVESQYILHTQASVLVGGNNAHYPQRVGPKGGAYVRYSEGEQQLDAFGLTRQSSPTQMAQYMFHYDTMPKSFHDEVDGGTDGTISHLMDESSVSMDVNTTSGAYAYRTTNRYHLYQTGYGTLCEMTVTLGDTGKANCRRRWGYFDTTDGLFFELDGTNLYVVKRSSTDGTATDTRIHRDDWNGDHVDGAEDNNNLSEMNLNLATLNLYWIDLTWLGGGKSRFGLFDESGARVTLHTSNHSNVNTAPYMSQANLPFRIEIENTGLTGSSSRIKFTGVAVKVEGNLIDSRSKLAHKYTLDSGEHTITDSTNWQHVSSFRSALTVGGRTNRHVTIPELASSYVEGGPVAIGLFEDTTAQGGTWTQYPGSAIEINGDATGVDFANGAQTPMVVWTHAGGGSTENRTMPDNFGLFSKNIILRADGNYGPTYSLCVKTLSDSTATYRSFPTLLDIT